MYERCYRRVWDGLLEEAPEQRAERLMAPHEAIVKSECEDPRVDWLNEFAATTDDEGGGMGGVQCREGKEFVARLET